MQHLTVSLRASFLALCAIGGGSPAFALATPMVQADPAPATEGGSRPPVQDVSVTELPRLPDGTLTSENSRQLGPFASVSAAVAAARSAGLGAGVYGIATVPGAQVAISAEGEVFLVFLMGGSGAPPRDSKDHN